MEQAERGKSKEKRTKANWLMNAKRNKGIGRCEKSESFSICISSQTFR
jgi:hypothetical protein